MTVTDEMIPWKLLKSHPDLSSQISLGRVIFYQLVKNQILKQILEFYL